LIAEINTANMTQKILRGLLLSTSSSIAKPHSDEQPALCPQRSHVNNDGRHSSHHTTIIPRIQVASKLFKPKNSFISFRSQAQAYHKSP
jgi:hypothetical protein